MTEVPPLVSTVVLAWNCEEDLGFCLDALSQSRGVEAEILVVDNSSGDRSAEVAESHPAVSRTIRNLVNLGCAGGNIVGWRAARGRLVVFVNPDCVVDCDALRVLTESLVRESSVGAAGAVLYYPNTTMIQHAGGFVSVNGIAGHKGEAIEGAALECD